ncbi:MAG: phosphoribosylformylglycinamidine synthase I [Candidatus Omnitrophota bacterium]|nr:MAG: phosphoribosylformylglycinamidine synthase I [Candidatus Omnitrophota bacterium]
MRFGIVVFPGSNCDADCFFLIKNILSMPVEYIWHKQTDLDGFDCVILPGGFSYGDYLRTGAIARFSPIMPAIVEFAQRGGLVIGICNGFQILLETGLLPGAMLTNAHSRFICSEVYLKVENTNTPFTHLCRDRSVLKIPIAHNQGNYYIDKKGLEEINRDKQIVFRYSDKKGEVSRASNPNGSVENIAGIVNKQGNVLGMMPHPERAGERILGSEDGLFIFDSVIKWLEK